MSEEKEQQVEYASFYARKKDNVISFGHTVLANIILVVEIDEKGNLSLGREWHAMQEEKARQRDAWQEFLLRTVRLPSECARLLCRHLPPTFAQASGETMLEYLQWIALGRIKLPGVGNKTVAAVREHMVKNSLLEIEEGDDAQQ